MNMDYTQQAGRPPVSPPRRFMQQCTHAAHVRLNHHPLLAGITKPGFSMQAYRLIIAAYFHCYQCVETVIVDCLARYPAEFDYTMRLKLPWLAADLRHLDIDPFDCAYLPARPIKVPPTTSLGQVAGVLYAIEGSTLGGQFMSRHLARHLLLEQDSGARFFHGYGTQTQARWDQFNAFLNAVCADQTQLDAAGQAARSMFALIEGLLDDYQEKRHD